MKDYILELGQHPLKDVYRTLNQSGWVVVKLATGLVVKCSNVQKLANFLCKKGFANVVISEKK